MMAINVLNIEENKKYVDRNEYILKGIDTEGEYQTINPKLRFLRLWLDVEFPFKIINNSMEFKFEKKSSSISLVAGIIEKGIDNDKHYVLANFRDYIIDYPFIGEWEYDSKVFEDILGEFEVNVSFSTEMITNGDKLYEFIGEGWPSFHDSALSILEYNSEKTVLRFHDALPDDYVLDLTIRGIVWEEFGEKTFDFFTNGVIKCVKFSKVEEYMEVKITHYYCSENEGNIKDTESFGIIRCRELEVNFQKI